MEAGAWPAPFGITLVADLFSGGANTNWRLRTCAPKAEITERAALTRALDELQRQMKVIPQDVIYQPTFSYIWMLAEDRFGEELRKRVARKTALREIARAYLAGAGMTLLGETARASGLSTSATAIIPSARPPSARNTGYGAPTRRAAAARLRAARRAADRDQKISAA